MKIEKTVINSPSRQLSAKWTMESSDTEMQITADFAKQIQEEIDWGVITSLLVSTGWIEVNLNRYDHDEIEQWVKENCEGRYKHRHGTWIFESKEDAVWFKLKWL